MGSGAAGRDAAAAAKPPANPNPRPKPPPLSEDAAESTLGMKTQILSYQAIGQA